jgi:hypothetical protein
MIGNAVPVRLGEAIGKSILSHLEAHQPSTPSCKTNSLMLNNVSEYLATKGDLLDQAS